MIRVLVVDDSALVRKLLRERLSSLPDIQVVGTAIDPYQARELIVELHPDVLTLDVEMPRMDGLSFLAKLMKHHPIPVVVVSSVTPDDSETALRALKLGAVEVIPKPGTQFSVPDVERLLARAVRAAARSRPGRLPEVRAPKEAPPSLPQEISTSHKIVALGASTGGTRAIEKVLRGLPRDAPPVLLVQHMPGGFTSSFAARLDDELQLSVKEASDGDLLAPGQAYLAPGGKHLLLRRNGARYELRVRGGPPVNRHRPSVDVLFRSVARHAGKNAVGVILTGMGRDGAEGLLEMKRQGAHTIGQDEATSVVYGMPAAAAEAGALEEMLPLAEISGAVIEAVSRQHEVAAP